MTPGSAAVGRPLARGPLAAALAVALLAACTGPTPPASPGPPECTDGSACNADGAAGICIYATCRPLCTPGQTDCCVDPRQCPAGPDAAHPAVCVGRQATRCAIACASASDCASLAHVAGPCRGSDCVCDAGRCVPPPCRQDADCPAPDRCVAGHCGPGLVAATCRILPGPVAVAPGRSRSLTAVARDARGPGLPATPFSWASSDPAVVSVAAPTGELTGGTTPGTALVTARTGAAHCAVPVENLAAPPPGDLRVVAVDPDDHAALAGVMVVVRQAGHVLAEGHTGARGAVDLPGVPAGPVDVDVLPLGPAGPGAPNGRTWVTLEGVAVRSLLVPLPPNPVPGRAAGVRGRLPVGVLAPDGFGPVQIGLVGLSWPRDLTALDLRKLVGPFRQAPNPGPADLRMSFWSGMVFGLGGTMITDRYAPVGLPGPRVLFALAGDPTHTDVLGHLGGFISWNQSAMSAGDMAAALIPDLDDASLRAFARPVTPVTAVPLAAGAPDFGAFPRQPVTLGPTLDRRVRFLTPSFTLDEADAGFEGILAVVGIFADGEGFVPLGMTLGVDDRHRSPDEAPDGVIDGVDGNPDGEVDLRFAPASGGLEGKAPYLLLLAGATESLAGGDPMASGARASRLIPLEGLPAGSLLHATAPLLPLPSAAAWQTTARRGEATFPPGTVHRWLVQDALGHRWIALTTGDPVTLPAAPAACTAPACADPAAAPAHVWVEALRLAGGLDYPSLVRLDGEDLDRLPRLTAAGSRREVPLP